MDKYTEAKLQLRFDVQYEFCLDRGYIEEGDAVSRSDLRDILTSLSQPERAVYEERLTRKMETFDELIERDQKTFDEPHIEHSDLIDGVRIPSFEE